MIAKNQDTADVNQKPGSNSDREDNDKAPSEEQGIQEKITPDDLKGKNVDADPSTEEGQPIRQ